MKRLARWFRKRGLPLLGHAAGVVVSGGKTAIPGVLKKVTQSLGLPDTATQQEILAILSGSHGALALMRQIEKGTTPAEVQADVDKYLGQLEYDLQALKEAGQTNRVDVQSGDKFISWARPAGLYLSFAWTTGWLAWIWKAWSKSADIQERLILGCVDQATALESCLRAVHDTPMPITTLATSLQTIPIWALIAPFAPILSYYPLRSLDKLITRSVIGDFDRSGPVPRFQPGQYIQPQPVHAIPARQDDEPEIPELDMRYREVDFVEVPVPSSMQAGGRRVRENPPKLKKGPDKKANRFE